MASFKTYKCPLCEFSGRMRDLKLHRITYHKDISWVEYLGGLYGMTKEELTCPICKNKFRKVNPKNDTVIYKTCGDKECVHELYNRARKKQWENPEFRELMSESSRRTMSKTMKRLWSTQEYRDFHSEISRKAMINLWATEEFKASHLARYEGKDLYLYLIGFKDLQIEEFVVKVGVTTNIYSRLEDYFKMNYRPLKVFTYKGNHIEIVELESKIHFNRDFIKFEMDKRTTHDGGFGNGSSEWYQASEFKKIKSFLENDLHLTLEEIKL